MTPETKTGDGAGEGLARGAPTAIASLSADGGEGGFMEFYYKNVDDGVLILSADGGLDRGTAEQFVGELRKIIESGASKIIVDCTQLNYVSLHGLRTLFGLHKALAGHGGDVKVAAVQGKIAGLVAESRLSNVFHVYPYVDRARMAFRRGS
jgi:anti-anti-sigma factor